MTLQRLAIISIAMMYAVSLVFSAPVVQDSTKKVPAKPAVKSTSVSPAKAPADTAKKAAVSAPKSKVKNDSVSSQKDSAGTASGDSIKADTATQAGFGRCSVLTEPSEALVYIGDSLKGKSPLLLDSLLPGTIDLQIKKKGYFIRKASVAIEAGKSQTVIFELSKPKRLVIITEPAGALLTMNGADTARTPYLNEKIKADTVMFSITHQGFNAVVDTVALGTEGDSLFFNLTPLKPVKDSTKAVESPAQANRSMKIRALISLAVFLVFTGVVLGVELSR
jgi:hypothetical protein